MHKKLSRLVSEIGKVCYGRNLKINLGNYKTGAIKSESGRKRVRELEEKG